MNDGGEEHLAPVIPLFGGDRRGPSQAHPARAASRGAQAGEAKADQWRSALMDGSHRPRSVHAQPDPSKAGPEAGEPSAAENDPDEFRDRAEEVLVRKLRGKQLSVSEARNVLRMTDVDRDVAESIIEEFLHRGYLDDRTLAQLLVTSGVERKGQGRVALSRSLSQRGIPRDIVDEVLGELPDDDAERALDYARSKASSMSGLEPDTALRRLLGQLARRGYGGSIAMNAARTALREAGSGRSGVRFADSD
jgi:regulatory protein